MLTSKGDDYQEDADPWSGFRRSAAHLGIDVVTAGEFFVEHKLSRLATLRVNGRTPRNEGVEDSYKDLAGYALLTYAMYLDSMQSESPARIEDTVGSERVQHDNDGKNPARVGHPWVGKKHCTDAEPHVVHYWSHHMLLCDGTPPNLQYAH